jgi:hypothetical protein
MKIIWGFPMGTLPENTIVADETVSYFFHNRGCVKNPRVLPRVELE